MHKIMDRIMCKEFEQMLYNNNIYWEKWNTYEGYVRNSNYLTGECYDVSSAELIGFMTMFIVDMGIDISRTCSGYYYIDGISGEDLFWTLKRFLEERVEVRECS
jgi:hypothetical protein